MFMFNLLFDFSKTDGIFSGDFTGAGATILDKSKNWLKQPQKDPADPFSTGQPWQDLQEGTLLVPNPIGEAIGVRIAPHRNGPVLTAPVLDLAVCFGSRDLARTPFASPFATAANETIATFHHIGVALPAAGFWYFRLDKIVKASPHVNKAHRYEFVIGAIIRDTPGGVLTTRTYGHDPQMDIGL
jgi:hypothetical protein